MHLPARQGGGDGEESMGGLWSIVCAHLAFVLLYG